VSSAPVKPARRRRVLAPLCPAPRSCSPGSERAPFAPRGSAAGADAGGRAGDDEVEIVPAFSFQQTHFLAGSYGPFEVRLHRVCVRLRCTSCSNAHPRPDPQLPTQRWYRRAGQNPGEGTALGRLAAQESSTLHNYVSPVRRSEHATGSDLRARVGVHATRENGGARRA
jgi:hypothetical protein